MKPPPSPSTYSAKDMPCMLPADNALRRKIGLHVALNEIFTPEKIKACQQLVDNTHSEFLAEIQVQIDRIGEACMKAAKDPAQADVMLKQATECAFTLKKRMETLGFLFGFKVAKSLCDYMGAAAGYQSEALLVVSKHIAVLNIVLKDNITGDGGAIGQELLANLDKLIRKTES